MCDCAENVALGCKQNYRRTFNLVLAIFCFTLLFFQRRTLV